MNLVVITGQNKNNYSNMCSIFYGTVIVVKFEEIPVIIKKKETVITTNKYFK